VQHGPGNAKSGDHDGDTGAVNHLGGGRKTKTTASNTSVTMVANVTITP
jgi:hypothetical protein